MKAELAREGGMCGVAESHCCALVHLSCCGSSGSRLSSRSSRWEVAEILWPPATLEEVREGKWGGWGAQRWRQVAMAARMLLAVNNLG